MKTGKLISVAGAFVLATVVSGCGTMDRETVGTAGGAALGGLAGSEISGGSTAGTVGGAAVGGVVGNQVTRPPR